MSIFILCVMIAIEIGLGVFTICKQREKGQWYRNRCLVNCGELVVYFIMILLPGIDFTFRFKGFFFVLLLRAVISAIIFLIKRSKAEGDKKISEAMVSVIFSIFLLAISLVPSFIFSDYAGKETTGEHGVEVSQAILVDPNRVESFETDGSNREVPVYFFYPEDADGTQKYPVVLFSHGAFGYYPSNTSTYMELASHGYVVISLDHPYHSFFTEDTDGKLITVNPEFLNEIMYINEDTTPEEEIYALSSKWLTIREDDINFVLDTMETASDQKALSKDWFLGKTEETKIVNILNSMDCSKIGLMGHSLGGAAVVSIGRERDDISAVVDLDGTMLGEQIGFENGAYIMEEDPYPIAILSIDNEEHHIQGEQSGSYYVNNVILDNALDGHNTYFAGSGHMNFTDLPLFAPPLANMLGTGTIDVDDCIETMNQIILDYMNHYLKGEGEFNLKESYE